MITRCGRGFDGCVPPTRDDRLQAYARALGGNYDPLHHALRAMAGLAILKALRKIWKKRDAMKRRGKPRKAAPKKSTVVPFRRRA